MFAKSLIAVAAIAGSVSAAPIEARGKSAPAGWWTEGLEPYMTYHTRYLALQCYNHKQANDQFWNDCCSPLLKDQSLSSRPDYCTPSAADVASVSSSLAAKYGAATPTGVAAAPSASASSDSDYETVCEEEGEGQAASAVVSASSSAVAAAATADSTPSSTAEPSASPSPSTTQAAPAYVAQEPTTTSTTTQQAQQTQASSNSGNGQTYSGGYATYFTQNGNPGACGNYNSDSTPLVAIDQDQWYASGSGSFGSPSSLCGKWVTITNTNNGKSVTAQVQDVCPTCANSNSLDLSVGAFTAIASEADGMVPITWHFN